ncbi:MAG: glycosyl transferase family 2, partial [Acidimicrobiales bacterium]|nr:glycosyl transferase family 2 [Acidimicrobiales bacterium]
MSIVIPTRNRLPYLKDAITSVLHQDVAGWDLVVVDDASTDGTWEWLQTFTDPRIRCLRRDRPGERAVARNEGLAVVRAAVVLFLDDDDMLHRSALRRLTRSLHRHPTAFAAVGGRRSFGAGGGEYRYPFPRWPVVRTAWREVVAGWVATPGQMLVRTEVLRAIGGWSPEAVPAEDVDLWLRADGRPAAFVPTTVLSYRVHDGARPPADVEGIEAELRARFVASTSGSRRAAASRLVDARAAIREANAAFRAGRPRPAARALSRALRLAPELLRSPILGPSLLASL